MPIIARSVQESLYSTGSPIHSLPQPLVLVCLCISELALNLHDLADLCLNNVCNPTTFSRAPMLTVSSGLEASVRLLPAAWCMVEKRRRPSNSALLLVCLYGSVCIFTQIF